MKHPTISALILAKNEELMLPGCIKTLEWCHEIVVLDDSSDDKTVSIAEDFGAKVIHFSHPSFAKKRMQLAQYGKGDWLLYVDPDERLTPELAQEITENLNQEKPMQMVRKNIFFGHEMSAGGWQEDTVTRVFPRHVLTGWKGDIHESPVFNGETLKLRSPLIHFSHRTIQDGLLKSAYWTKLEAEALCAAHIQPVTASTIVRKAIGELYRRLLKYRGYRDGSVGYIEAVIQSINKILVYLQVWELQQNPSISTQYKIKEREIELLWEASKKGSL